jgi:hypothetical protein
MMPPVEERRGSIMSPVEMEEEEERRSPPVKVEEEERRSPNSLEEEERRRARSFSTSCRSSFLRWYSFLQRGTSVGGAGGKTCVGALISDVPLPGRERNE